MNISTRKLVQIAGWGGLIVATTGFYLQNRLVDRVRNFDYYKDALKILRRHPGAVHYLGEPIKDKKFKLSDNQNNFADGATAKFCVPVSGQKDRGSYYFWAEKLDDKWSIVKAELELKSKPDERLVIDKNITIDLRNDSYVCGQLTSVDGYMNLSLSKTVYCDTQGNEYYFDNLFVQARNIRYVHIPEDVSILGNIKNEFKKVNEKDKRDKDDKLQVKSRKAKKALQQHMKIVASLDN